MAPRSNANDVLAFDCTRKGGPQASSHVKGEEMAIRILLIVALLLFGPSWGPSAEEKTAQEPAGVSSATATKAAEKSSPPEKLAITHHALQMGGQVLNYTATAGYLQLKDDSGKPRADLFFVAYMKEPQEDGSRRPITFLFNGGPGASSVWLHLGAVGPKRVPLDDIEKPQPPPYKAIDNEFTWLWDSDLVFIDPVGAGFSRAAPGESPKQFYGIKEDIQAVGDFIRLYTTRAGRWTSPKFLAGESYGTLRAVGLANYLYDTYGMSVNGLILISLAIDFQSFSFDSGNDLPYALFLPSYTASAWYHKKLAPELQQELRKTLDEAERWALQDYLVALAKGDSISAGEREKVAETLASYTGLSKSFVENNDLRIARSAFMNELLRAEQLSVGLVDSRTTSHAHTGDFLSDPGVVMTVAPYTAVLNDYVRDELKFESDLPYVVLSEEANGQWNWGSAIHGYVSVLDTLQKVVNRSPYVRVFAACGTFDLDTPYMGSRYSLNHVGLDPKLQGNIEVHYYDGGHMLYTHRPSLQRLTEDVRAFLKSAIPMAL
jgi:carboxypeptidase C (cathepsin A)